MKDALEYLMILVFVAVLVAATVNGTLIQPASRLFSQLSTAISGAGGQLR